MALWLNASKQMAYVLYHVVSSACIRGNEEQDGRDRHTRRREEQWRSEKQNLTREGQMTRQQTAPMTDTDGQTWRQRTGSPLVSACPVQRSAEVGEGTMHEPSVWMQQADERVYGEQIDR